ncbi:MAG TPA: hypothetical protein VK790_03500 [Solirubrobacteraceae bacterium]|nr:hypothetical protein [Solirubrobacteraceae bacterium]
MLNDAVHEIGADLHLADAGLRLRVGDLKARAVGVVQANMPDLDVAELAGARPSVAEDLHHDPPPDVAAPDLQPELCKVVADGGLGEPKLPRDLLGRLALAVKVRHLRGGEPELDRSDVLGERDVLLGRRVDQRGELVHLEERPLGLGDMDAHALPARGVVVDVAVLDRVVEDRGEPVEHFADRARRQRHHALLVPVAQIGARLDRLAQLARLLELVRLEREAEVGVDLIEPVVGEERQQMRLDLPAVLLLSLGADRLGPEHAVDLGLQPARGVLAERRHARVDGRARWRASCRWRPHPGLHAREDVLELHGGGAFVPVAPTAAVAVTALVQAHGLAFAVGAEAQPEAERSVARGLGRDRACGWACHQLTANPRRVRAWQPRVLRGYGSRICSSGVSVG